MTMEIAAYEIIHSKTINFPVLLLSLYVSNKAYISLEILFIEEKLNFSIFCMSSKG